MSDKKSERDTYFQSVMGIQVANPLSHCFIHFEDCFEERIPSTAKTLNKWRKITEEQFEKEYPLTMDEAFKSNYNKENNGYNKENNGYRK